MVDEEDKLRWRDVKYHWRRSSKAPKVVDYAGKLVMDDDRLRNLISHTLTTQKSLSQCLKRSTTPRQRVALVCQSLQQKFHPVIKHRVQKELGSVLGKSSSKRRRCNSSVSNPSLRTPERTRPRKTEACTPETARLMRKALFSSTSDVIQSRRKRILTDALELGKIHEQSCEHLNDLGDGALTSLGIASALVGSPSMTTLLLSDTIFTEEYGVNGKETLAEMCVRQHNSVKFVPIKQEVCKVHLLLNTSQQKFEEICRPAVQRMGKLLNVPPLQSDITWSWYRRLRQTEMNKSRVRFFSQTQDAKSMKTGGIYCHDRSAFQQNVLARPQVQSTLKFIRSVYEARIKGLDPRYIKYLEQIQSEQEIPKILTGRGHMPWWLTGDGAAMYQMDATNIRFALTVIAMLTPLMGRPSPYALHLLAAYADRDDAKCIKQFIQDPGALKALCLMWDSFEVNGEIFVPKCHGLTCDTKFAWECLRRKANRSWSKGLGGTFRDRSLFMKTDPRGLTTCVTVRVHACATV